MTTAPHHQTVAVIGLGAMGLVAVKNLLEEGFDTTGFDRHGYIGGLWHFTEDKNTLSALKETQLNVSTDRGCFTDYPFPDGTPAYCMSADVEQYLENFVDHFGLRPRLQLGATITHVTREDDSGKWRLDFESGPSKYFDKVIMSTGPHVKPLMPKFSGAEHFQGDIIHSQAFKGAQGFEGKRALVVGMGNTVGDLIEVIAEVASSIYLSHERGALVLPRVVNGKPAAYLITQRKLMIQSIFKSLFPSFAERMTQKKAAEIMFDALGKPDPAWKLEPVPSPTHAVPIVSDTLIDNLRSGVVESVPGIQSFPGGKNVELKDGRTIEVDIVVCCTGYQNDLSILDLRHNPSSVSVPAWTAAPGSRGRPLPQLYQNVFSLQHPESLAFLGCAFFATGAFQLADLASMSIAQVWAGKSTLPSPEERQRWVDRQNEWVSELAHHGTPVPAIVPQIEWLRWVDKTVGAGLFDRLGWGWKGWVFWWTDRKLWRMIMDGVLTSASWRLFDEGKRKPWNGARAEIVRLNENAEVL